MEEKRAMTLIYFLVSWAVALGSPAVPSAAAYNWTFLVFRPTAKMVRFIKSNCAGASSRRMTCKASAQLANPPQDETGFDLMFNSILFRTLQQSRESAGTALSRSCRDGIKEEELFDPE